MCFIKYSLSCLSTFDLQWKDSTLTFNVITYIWMHSKRKNGCLHLLLICQIYWINEIGYKTASPHKYKSGLQNSIRYFVKHQNVKLNQMYRACVWFQHMHLVTK